MVRIVYVDDSLINRGLFERLCAKQSQVSLLALFEDSASCLDFCKSNHVQLVFLDIEMPGNDGLWLAESLSKLDIPFVFLTAHREYAIDAFRVFALHYLLKPITAEGIQECLNRYINHHKQNENFSISLSEENPITYSASVHYPKRVFVNTVKKVEVLHLEDIVYMEAESSYTFFFLRNGVKITSGKTMKTYNNVLQNPDFVKIHRSFIINQSFLVSINKLKSEYLFVFKQGFEIRLSSFDRSKLKSFSDE